MLMFQYPVLCYTPDCGKRAEYKIAARWSDGVTQELKTYGLCCEECLAEWFRRSREKQKACVKAKGETLDPPSIFRIEHGRRDRQLQHLPDKEQALAGE
ncbi:hypothetical protein AYO40_02700 [Planctomycetaceae bacterium SCGC AG-212-D15]|nr:hypothetical protein AYO40_02700 [Planctomycetaceae bacterium SCGC AG-212-D15]